MNDRDLLILALAAHARRLRLNALLREFAWMACAIPGALLLYQILAAAIPSAEAANALGTLLVLLLAGVVVVLALRGMRPIPLEEVAATADARADLKDELKTGHFFARHEAASALVELQIRRAARTAQRLDPRKVFPILIPRSAFAAAGLALAAGVLTWAAPHFGYSRGSSAEAINAGSAMTSTKAREGRLASEPTSPRSRDVRTVPERGQMSDARGTDAQWARLETAIQALAAGDELKDLAAAVKRHDATRASQLLEEFNRKQEFARAQSDARAVAGGERASPDLIARLQELFGPGGNVPQSALDGGAGDQLEQALDLAQRLDEDMRSSGRNNPASHDLEEGTNPLQAAVPLERFGPREARRSSGQGGEFAGTTDVEGGAMGRRVTQSNVGAGGKPGTNEASMSSNVAAEEVLGAHTMRLDAQLKQVKVQGNHAAGGDAQGIAEGAYAATRAQQALSDYQDAPQHARYVTENTIGGERIPLAYRGAVKEYFLDLDRNEK